MAERLKDIFFTDSTINKFSDAITQYYPEFDKERFKKHSFIDMSTRKHYSGKHGLAIIVNGEKKASLSFEVGKY